MTILTEAEQAATLVYYERGWSYQEIVAELLALRAENLKLDVQREVVSITTHRFSSNAKRTALKDIIKRGSVWRGYRRGKNNKISSINGALRVRNSTGALLTWKY